ncbi:MAG TPA: hypothetical protein VKP69_19170, partial [Isosphaeraceae bacterium]|nr:hypothetical protein [Isosphaeraceae bacterium]
DALGRLYERFKAAARALGYGGLIDRLETGYLERSPSGGFHWLYRCEVIAASAKLAQYNSDEINQRTGKPIIKPLIETRGNGSYIVLAPSNGRVYPTGQPYVHLAGSFDSIPTISPEEREFLLDLARSFDELPQEGPKAAAKASGRPPAPDLLPKEWTDPYGWPDTSSPIDDYNERADWTGLLEGHGWEFVGTAGETQYWRRPGKAQGISATLNHGGHGLFHVFTSSCDFQQNKSVSKFGAYAVLEHGGDFKAARLALIREGYGTHKRWVWADGTWELRIFPNPCPPGERSAKQGEGPPKATGGDSRPVILISTEEYEVIDRAVEALAADPELYRRGTALVRVVREESRPQGVIRAEGSPRLDLVPQANLRDRLTRVARWVKSRKTRDGDGDPVAANPPEWAVAGVAARGEWPKIRAIEAVVETPVLRLDGSILDTPGYDEKTGLLYIPNATFPPVPEFPTHGDAKEAAERLLTLVADFPFAGDKHKAAWLASLLTPLGRFAIAGPCPLFLFDANTAGSGKTMLCDITSILTTGRDCARTAYPATDEEMDKRILAIALAGYRMILFDNLETGAALGGSALDAALTGTSYNGRILARSEMANDIPLFTVWYANGNNLGLRGDAIRRIVPCRLDSRVERPEERSDFKIPDLLAHVREHRGELVADALTILRAYVVAGRPGPAAKLTPIGFPAWERVVRRAVHWAIGVDPCQTREEIRAADDIASQLPALIEGWAQLCESEGEAGLTCATALRVLDAEFCPHTSLRGLLVEWSKDGKLPSPRTLGNHLNKI